MIAGFFYLGTWSLDIIVQSKGEYKMEKMIIGDIEIEIYRKKIKNRPGQPEHRYALGESIYLWGKRYGLEVHPS